jgi:hypothetical protein
VNAPDLEYAALLPMIIVLGAAVAVELVASFDLNVGAGAELGELTRPREDLPDWRIVDPPPAEELLSYYRAAQDEFGVPWEYLASIHLVETRMGRIRGVSVAGGQVVTPTPTPAPATRAR